MKNSSLARTRRRSTPPARMVGSKELRRALTDVLGTIQATDARFLVTVKGKPQAILMGVQDYVRRVLGERSDALLVSLQQDAKRAGADRLAMRDIDREIAAVRRAKRSRNNRRRS